MARRWLLWFSVAAAVAASGCASGDGAPEARILNHFTGGCIVEASFLGYNFTSPIGASGIMASREVYEGTDKAYAITMEPPAGGTCYDTVTLKGGTLWVTNKSWSATAGQRTDIVFAADTATQVPTDCNDLVFREGLKRFSRLSSWCTQ